MTTYPPTDQLTDNELDIMIEEIDSDGSGTVDFDGKELMEGRDEALFKYPLYISLQSLWR